MRPTRLRPRWIGDVPVSVVGVAVLAAVATGLQVRGPDLPAQLFRAEQFREHGLVLWNGLWYSGHNTATYSVLVPAVSSVLGPSTVGILSSVLAVLSFDRLARRRFPAVASASTMCFAASVLLNLVIGRLTFACGVATGLGALLAWQRGRTVATALLAVATPLTSPVAGAFLALAAGARVVSGIAERNVPVAARAIGVLLATSLPAVTLGFLFPGIGPFPISPATVLVVLMVAGAGVALAPPEMRDFRAGAVLLGLVVLGLAVLPNGLGGNLRRFVEMFGPALAMVVFGPARRRIAFVGASTLLVWSSVFALDVIDAVGDPSVDGQYYEPLLEFLDRHQGAPARVEIAFTEQHWEAYYVAREFPIARGWERQTDIARNPLFYGEPMRPDEYEHWLKRSAVRFVILPATELDPSARTEAEILRNPPPWLQERWSSSDFTVFEVDGWRPIVDGAVREVEVGVDSIRFLLEAPGQVLIRSHYTPHWRVAEGEACIRPTADGLTLVEGHAPGRIVLDIDLDLVPIGHDEYCSDIAP